MKYQLCQFTCRYKLTFAILCPIVFGLTTWLLLSVHAQAVEQERIKTQLEGMASDVKEIKEILKEAARKAK